MRMYTHITLTKSYMSVGVNIAKRNSSSKNSTAKFILKMTVKMSADHEKKVYVRLSCFDFRN